jgi:hypothetical protein
VEIDESLIAAKELVQIELLSLPGVTGVGIGMREAGGEQYEDEVSVRVYVADAEAVPDGIPEEVGGVAVSVIELQLELSVPDYARYDPLLGGIRITPSDSDDGGTLGTIVKREGAGGEAEYFGLSCYHVVGGPGEANVVWQPRKPSPLIDEDEAVGAVVAAEFPQPVPLVGGAQFGFVDAAIFALDKAASVGRGSSTAIAGHEGGYTVEEVTASEAPEVGQRVRKRGFVTRLTEGKVVDAHVAGLWKGGSNTYLAEQVLAEGRPTASNPNGYFSLHGDSGSLVLDGSSPTAVGLLWGSNPATALTEEGRIGVFSKIRHVELALGVTPVL